MTPAKQAAVICVDVQSAELFDVCRSSLGALGNLLCLSQRHQPSLATTRIGLCSLLKAEVSGKVQIQVRRVDFQEVVGRALMPACCLLPVVCVIK